MTLVAAADWTPQGVAELEEAAWTALREVERSVCVTAGAGAGKTEFLAQKAAYLLQTGLCPAPKRILAISFKRDAAATLSDRVRRRCPPEQSRRFVSMTFDAFAKSLVDQFRMSIPERYRPPADYRIAFSTAQDIGEFLRRESVNDINAKQFDEQLAKRRLLDPAQEVNEHREETRDAYWADQYGRGPEPLLTFRMINRLAEYLLRTNARIRRAIRASYPHVFLDEFQDAQECQFELLSGAFDPARTRFTAVGDRKQRIMGWAGAMPDAFGVFTEQFDAVPVSLALNWRSHEDLVAIQQIVAQNLDPETPQVVAKGQRAIDGAIAAIWEYDDPDEEIGCVAAWLERQVNDEDIPAHDIAVLVRNNANRMEEELGPALAERGLTLRNLARNVGDAASGQIAIEELLTEELTDIFLPFLRLGSSRRNPDAWSAALTAIRSLDDVADDDDIALQRINDRVETVARNIRTFLQNNDPSPDAARRLVDVLIDEVGEEEIRRSTPAYQRDGDFARVRNGFQALLAECASATESWADALDLFEGRNQVPLLTVHKSKGMEFHTVIFFGFDSQTWWSLTPDRTEEINSFFVALTRAMQRAFFTSCSSRGGRIAWLEEILGDAVPRVDGSEV